MCSLYPFKMLLYDDHYRHFVIFDASFMRIISDIHQKRNCKDCTIFKQLGYTYKRFRISNIITQTQITMILKKLNTSCLISNPHQFSRTNTFCLENANLKKVTFAKDLSMRRASNMQLKRHQMCDQNFIEQNVMTQLHQIIIKKTSVYT